MGDEFLRTLTPSNPAQPKKSLEREGERVNADWQTEWKTNSETHEDVHARTHTHSIGSDCGAANGGMHRGAAFLQVSRTETRQKK